MLFYTDKELEDAINSSKSMQEVCEKLGYRGKGGGARIIVQRRAENLAISLEHLSKRKVGRTKHKCLCKNCNAEIEKIIPSWKLDLDLNYFCSKSCAASYNNKQKLGEFHPNFKDGSSGYRQQMIRKHGMLKCRICGYDIVVEIHHRDGNRKNNDIDNLDMLCPNHHAEYEQGIRTY